ncbi:MAG: HEAT repeat domain-containing protein [Planctomycetes bacterium]|nr:HEAT repeat domain-containing protein [Planctomycetota bacterium]
MPGCFWRVLSGAASRGVAVGLLVVFGWALAEVPGQAVAWPEAVARFERDGDADDESTRTAAILGLAEPGDPAILGYLEAPLRDWARFLDQFERTRLGLVAKMERLSRDLEGSDEERKRRAEREKLKIDEEMRKAEAQIARLRANLDAGAGALARVGSGLKYGAATDYVKRVQEHAFRHREWFVRVAYVDVLSRMRRPEMLEILLQRIEAAHEEIQRLGRVRQKKDRVLEDALDKFARRPSVPTQDKLLAAQREAAAIADEEHGERCTLALALDGLVRQVKETAPEAQDRALSQVLAALSAARAVDARAGYLEALARIGGPAVVDAVRDLAAKPSAGAGERIALARAVATLADGTFLPWLVGLLEAPEWAVRAAAIEALRALRDRRAVAPLIGRLEKESGRLQDDLEEAIEDLTGVRYGIHVALWRKWLAENGDSFEVPPRAAAKAGEAAGAAKEGGELTSFYGIVTRSRNIVYVLDISGSMNEEAAGNVTKITRARQELRQAVASLPPKASFNVIFYATAVSRWQRKMLQAGPAATKNLESTLAKIGAAGATNTHGALLDALALAGAGGADLRYQLHVDTIFFLSDGHPTVGAMTDPQRILEEVRTLNRLRRITIHTVGVGKDHNIDFMRRLAEENGGTYAAR